MEAAGCEAEGGGDFQAAAFAENGGAVDDCAQLADVAGPGVEAERFDVGFGR